MDSDWFFEDAGKPVGPFKLEALASRVQARPSVLVWTKGMESWCEARLRPEFANVLAYAPPPPPPFHATPVAGSPASTAVDGVHAWRRYFARTLDVFVFAAVLGGAGALVFPDVFNSGNKAASQILGFLAVALYIPFDAILTMAFGSSLGKAVYGIHVVRPADFGFGRALKRAFMVWFFGFGAGIPIASLVTLILSYQKLSKQGWTSWDRATDCRVTHSRLSVIRWLLVALVWVLLIALAIYGQT